MARSLMERLAVRPLLRNVGFLTLSRGITLLSGLVISAWLARKLEPTNFGNLGFATAVTSYFGVIVAIGLETLGARDIARKASRVRVLASHIVTLRLVLAVVAMVGLGLFVLLLDRSVAVKILILVQGMGMLAFALNLDFVFQGQGRMHVVAGREIAVALLTLGGIVFFIRSPDNVVLAAVILVIAPLVGSVLVMARCWREFRAPLPRMNRRLWKGLVKAALPIATAGMLVTVYRNLDTLMLGFLRSPGEVGQYVAAFKFFTTGLAPTMILLTVFTPGLARAWGNADDLRRVTSQFSAAVAAVMVPVACGGIAFAPEVIAFLFGPFFLPAADAARFLLAAALFAAFNIAFGYPLMLWGHQRQVIVPLVAGTALNAVANFLLIPRFGIEGAAAATLASEILLALWFAGLQLRRGGAIAGREIGAHGLAGVAAGALSWLLAWHFHLLVADNVYVALLIGPVLFVIIYGVMVAPYWRRLRARRASEVAS